MEEEIRLIVKNDTRKKSDCRLTNLYDNTTYEFRVRELCEDENLNPMIYDANDIISGFTQKVT